MKYRFTIGFDDREKLKPIFKKFGGSPFTRANILSEEILPDLTSGEISRWDSSNYIKKVPGIMDKASLWCLTAQTINILKKDM
jgi:hypothetical protein